MRIQPYRPDDIRYVHHYQAYFRWHTRWRRALTFDPGLLLRWNEHMYSRYGIRIDQFDSSENEFVLLVSLSPADAISAAASKLKGQLSKFLRAQIPDDAPLLGRGYFACTYGKNTRSDVEAYLERQERHHGYHRRRNSPAWVQDFEVPEDRLQATHAVVRLVFHVVLGTWRRKGFFTSKEAEAVAVDWMRTGPALGYAVQKASFLPDHVHLALHLHPTAAPERVIPEMMNAAQDLMFRKFPESLIHAGVERLWDEEAYLGSYGNINGAAMRGYLERWRSRKNEA